METHRDQYTWTDTERCGGRVCFLNTRIPVSILFDYLKADKPVHAFLEQYPGLEPGLVFGYLARLTRELERPVA